MLLLVVVARECRHGLVGRPLDSFTRRPLRNSNVFFVRSTLIHLIAPKALGFLSLTSQFVLRLTCSYQDRRPRHTMPSHHPSSRHTFPTLKRGLPPRCGMGFVAYWHSGKYGHDSSRAVSSWLLGRSHHYHHHHHHDDDDDATTLAPPTRSKNC